MKKSHSTTLIVFLVLVILIAMFGFWDTLSALLGSLLMIVLFAAVTAGLVVLVGSLAWRWFKGRA
ncbi:hypothetical protein [Skermanella stibiiresistens]|uniref:hypothetical protein n=1 Tax=Skermanella stibiiresistens TaxID=913326 RepID=UPI0004B02683|nr:hypothetical protein [Skermanella stibiiresistens]